MKINYILASLAIIGGISAAFTNHSVRNNLYPTWKYEKERIGGEKVHFISTMELAEILYKKKPGVTILDTRDEEAYREYHIPSALRYEKGDQDLDNEQSEKTVLYGLAGDSHLYDLSNYIPGDVYVLKGGIEEWYSVVLFPDFIKYHVRNNGKLEQIISKSRYFGGSPRNTQVLNITVRESRYREGC